ncbi:class I adenylate-forming enzyme family protein [Pseudaquabacterium terrae]|nr:class I adenylate-forming enzyme family protein [Aquabacterium terrae]
MDSSNVMPPSDCVSLVPAFAEAWQRAPRAGLPALVGSDRMLSYGELAAEVGSLSGRLHAHGIGRGDRVAIAMQRSLPAAVALLAVLACGACPCVLEPRLGRDETLRRFAITRLNRLLLDEAHAADDKLADLPGVDRLHIDALPPAQPFWAADIAGGDEGFLLFTSGSSGKPKGVLQSHRGLLANAAGVMRHTQLGPQDRLLHVMPLYHTNGVNNQLFAPLLAGASVVIAERFKADEMSALMARHRPTIITGVPTMYSRMLACDFAPEALASLRMARCGSAPITEELHRRVERQLGVELLVSYGLSEATCTSTMNPPGQRRIGTVGTVLAGQQVVLADGAGRPIEGPGRDGEICVDGPGLMLGYLDEQSGGRPRPIEGRLHTGDLGRFDAEGYLQITGRIKEVIIRGGENLSPNLIEEVLCRVPGVQACCVVGRPDADLGEVPWAFVVRSRDEEGLRLDDECMGRAVTAELSRIHKPAGYAYVEALPENSVGKVDRKLLAARVRQPSA